MIAARQLLDPCHDRVAMQEKLVPDNCVAGEDDETVALDHRRVGVGGVGGTDEFHPLLADEMLGGFAANLMLLQQLLDEGAERLSRPLLRSGGICEGHAPQFADEGLGELAEGVGFVRIGHEKAKRAGFYRRTLSGAEVEPQKSYHETHEPHENDQAFSCDSCVSW